MSSFVYPENQVFSFCGHIEDRPSSEVKSGYVVADTAELAIASMRDYGFVVSAITSLSEVKQTVSILELIAQQHPAVEPSEFVDVYPAQIRPYPEESVFCFTGHVVDKFGALKAGFIVASDVEFVINYLQGLGFIVESATSLGDLRQVMADMLKIAADDHSFDHSCVVNVKAAA